MKRGTASLLAVTASLSLAATAEPAKPNILFLSMDDLKPNLGCYGDALAISPNIDKLAAEGMIFDRCYCQQAICAPSRISMFTGKRPDSTGIWDLKTLMRKVHPDIVTIPQFFKKHGYISVGRGKLLHGAWDNDNPASWTWPYKQDRYLKYATSYGYPAGNFYLGEKIKKAYANIKDKKLSWRAGRDYMISHGASPSTECLDVPDAAYADGAIADEGIKLLGKLIKTGKPFFLALGFHKPHLPFVAPKKYWDMHDVDKFKPNPLQKHATGSPPFAYHNNFELKRGYNDIPKSGEVPKELQIRLIRGYYACVSYVDAQVGKVLDALGKMGLRSNTIVVLWGDHGWHLGDHGLWCKQTNFEQATRQTLIISVPSFPHGKRCDAIVESVDIFPTLCGLAGFKPPPGLEGRSLADLLKQPDFKFKDFAVSQYPRDGNKMGYALRTKRFRLVKWYKWSKDKGILDKAPIAVELYDYKNDPAETKNLAGNAELAGVLDSLSQKMDDFLRKKNLP